MAAGRAAQHLARLALARGNAPGSNLLLLAAGALVGFAAAEIFHKESSPRRRKGKAADSAALAAAPTAITNPMAVVAASSGTSTQPADLTGLVGGSVPSKVFIRASDHFASEFDAATRTPRWVIERLTRDNVVGEAERATAFKEEPGLPPALRARLTDYSGWRYDRGHMAPAANHRNSAVAMGDTFYLSNIAPQVGVGFNRDYWARLEKMVRDVARMPASKLPHQLRQELGRQASSGDKASESGSDAADATPAFDAVYVATGPLFLPDWDEEVDATRPVTDAASPSSSSSSSPSAALSRPHGRWVYRHEAIGDAGHWVAVPSHFYKVICAVARDDDNDDVQGGSGAGAGDGAGAGIGARFHSWLHSALGMTSSASGGSPAGAAADTGRAVAVAAFLMPNAPIPADTPLERFIVPLSVVEGAAGLQFFRDLLPPASEPSAVLHPSGGSGSASAGAMVDKAPVPPPTLKAIIGPAGAEAATALQQAGVDAAALTVMLAEAAWTGAPASSAPPQIVTPVPAAESPKRGRGRPSAKPQVVAAPTTSGPDAGSVTAGLTLLRENTARLLARGYPGPISRDIAPQLVISATDLSNGEGAALVPASAAASAHACLRVRHLCSIEDACRMPAENWFSKPQPATS